MINIESHYEHYEQLIQKETPEKIQQRYQDLYERMSMFIEEFPEGKTKLCINERILLHCVLEYFEDIEKVKIAHRLTNTNSPKVQAYTAYWILRRHPIQVLETGVEAEDLVFANEKFVLSMLMGYMMSGQETKPLVGDELKTFRAFMNSFYYYLKFRRLDAQAIEMVLLSFHLGNIFPRSSFVEPVSQE